MVDKEAHPTQVARNVVRDNVPENQGSLKQDWVTHTNNIELDPKFESELKKVQDQERKRAGGDNLDAGILAQLALQRRWQKDRKKRKIFWLSLLFVLLAAAGVGFWVYSQLLVVRDQHIRMCGMKSDDNEGYFITGQRVYDYSYYSLFGYQFQKTGDRYEKTQVNIRGKKTFIIQMTGNQIDPIKFDEGEQRVQDLKNADLYLFIIDDVVKGVTYEGFCR